MLRSTPWLAAFAACLSALACAARPPVADDASGGVPVAAFLRDPQMSHLALSPEGQRIAGIVVRDGLRVLVEKPVRESGVRFLGKLDEPGVRVRALGWSGPSDLVVGFDSHFGRDPRAFADRVKMVRVKIDRWRIEALGPSWTHPAHPDAGDFVLSWLPDDPERILVNRWESDAEGASVRSIRTRDGSAIEVVPPRPGVTRWFADHQGNVRVGVGLDPENGRQVILARRGVDDAFEPLRGVDPVIQSDLEYAGLAVDPDVLYVYSNTDGGTTGLFAYHLDREQAPLERIHADPAVDVGRLVYSPVDGRLWAVEVENERPQLHFIDAEAGREQQSIDATFPATINRLVDASRSGETALLRVSGDKVPPEYYLYDRERREMALLLETLPDLEDVALAEMQPVRFAARDGVEVPAYLTLPPGGEGRGLPAILIVHDGPTERVAWGFDPVAQLFASRGFAVLQPNFRGSSGYGRDYERMGRREWGGAMQHDLVDGARWIVSEGIADPGRIGIYGRGYGGYAALLGLAQAPEVFRAGAAFGAVTDLVELFERPSRYTSRDFNHPTEGRMPRDLALLAERSPARVADRIRGPVLLAHGALDRVVHVSQMRAMQDALEDAGAEPEVHLYRNAGHTFFDEGDRIDFHRELLAFFERSLSARVPL